MKRIDYDYAKYILNLCPNSPEFVKNINFVINELKPDEHYDQNQVMNMKKALIRVRDSSLYIDDVDKLLEFSKKLPLTYYRDLQLDSVMKIRYNCEEYIRWFDKYESRNSIRVSSKDTLSCFVDLINDYKKLRLEKNSYCWSVYRELRDFCIYAIKSGQLGLKLTKAVSNLIRLADREKLQIEIDCEIDFDRPNLNRLNKFNLDLSNPPVSVQEFELESIELLYQFLNYGMNSKSPMHDYYRDIRNKWLELYRESKSERVASCINNWDYYHEYLSTSNVDVMNIMSMFLRIKRNELDERILLSLGYYNLNNLYSLCKRYTEVYSNENLKCVCLNEVIECIESKTMGKYDVDTNLMIALDNCLAYSLITEEEYIIYEKRFEKLWKSTDIYKKTADYEKRHRLDKNINIQKEDLRECQTMNMFDNIDDDDDDVETDIEEDNND